MEKEEIKPDIQKSGDQSEDTEAIELVLFQVSECYVYIVSLAGLILIEFDFWQWYVIGRWESNWLLNWGYKCSSFILLLRIKI